MTIRRSKTDQEGAGTVIAIPRGGRLRPVERVQLWLEAARITQGPVFRSVLKGSRTEPEALQGRHFADVVKAYIKAIGLDATAFNAHGPVYPSKRHVGATPREFLKFVAEHLANGESTKHPRTSEELGLQDQYGLDDEPATQ